MIRAKEMRPVTPVAPAQAADAAPARGTAAAPLPFFDRTLARILAGLLTPAGH